MKITRFFYISFCLAKKKIVRLGKLWKVIVFGRSVTDQYIPMIFFFLVKGFKKVFFFHTFVQNNLHSFKEWRAEIPLKNIQLFLYYAYFIVSMAWKEKSMRETINISRWKKFLSLTSPWMSALLITSFSVKSQTANVSIFFCFTQAVNAPCGSLWNEEAVPPFSSRRLAQLWLVSAMNWHLKHSTSENSRKLSLHT